MTNQWQQLLLINLRMTVDALSNTAQKNDCLLEHTDEGLVDTVLREPDNAASKVTICSVEKQLPPTAEQLKALASVKGAANS